MADTQEENSKERCKFFHLHLFERRRGNSIEMKERLGQASGFNTRTEQNGSERKGVRGSDGGSQVVVCFFE